MVLFPHFAFSPGLQVKMTKNRFLQYSLWRTPEKMVMHQKILNDCTLRTRWCILYSSTLLIKHNIVLQTRLIVDNKSDLVEGNVEVVYRIRLEFHIKEGDISGVSTLYMMSFSKMCQTLNKLYGASQGAIPKFRHELT